jgi:CheY-like chemotaxis protein
MNGNTTVNPNEVEVLLIEDNPTDAELCIHALKKHNLANRLLHVKDGAEALEYIFGDGRYPGHNVAIYPKVVLLDLRLPKVDGIEVLRRIRGDERTMTMPVVVLTSSPEDKDRVASYQLGANSYIVKPVEFESFSKAVADMGLYWLLLNKPPK